MRLLLKGMLFGGGFKLAGAQAVVVKTLLASHFGVGEFTAHFRTYFSGDWDVHWGYDY